MVRAARSGKQNIIEGSAASSTSAKTEIKLLNVAKASLQELLADYEDYLHTRCKPQWCKGSREYEAMRELGRQHSDAEYFMGLVATRPPETIANMAIILINQADYQLFRQLKRLSEDFLRFLSFILTCCKSPVSLVLIVLNWYYIDNWWKIDASALWMFNGR